MKRDEWPIPWYFKLQHVALSIKRSNGTDCRIYHIKSWYISSQIQLGPLTRISTQISMHVTDMQLQIIEDAFKYIYIYFLM
jgi:hypothetical protein